MHIQATFTVTGGTVESLAAGAAEALGHLVGATHVGQITAMRITEGRRDGSTGRLLSWEAEVEAAIHPAGVDEEPF